MDVNAAWRPSFLRPSGGAPACRNARYDDNCVSRRKGTSSTLARLAKLLRMRFFSVKEYSRAAVVISFAIGTSRTGHKGWPDWRTLKSTERDLASPGGWWLASTSRWRTVTCRLRGMPPDPTCLLQSFQKTKNSGLVGIR